MTDTHPCNYILVNPLNTCYKCAIKTPHPFHDDGQDSRQIEAWYKGGEYGMPDFHNEGNGYGA